MGSSEFKTNTLVQVPVKVKVLDQLGNNTIMSCNIPTYLVQADVPFLIGLNQLRFWQAKVDAYLERVEIFTEARENPCTQIFAPRGSGHHMRLGLLPIEGLTPKKTTVYLINEVDRLVTDFGQSFVGKNGLEEKILFVRDTVTSEKFVKNLHEGAGHKGKDSLMHALSQAELIAPDTRSTVKDVVDSCKTCKKYRKSLPRRKMTLPKVNNPNQIITWDLKQ